MKQGSNRFGLLLAGLLVPLLAGTGARADDTDLFIAAFDPVVTGAQPNILFILDTSGSMSTDVVTQELWDPDKDFAGCYDGDAYYFTYGAIPACGSNNWAPKSSSFCKDAEQPLRDLGQYQGEFKAWRFNASRWVELNANYRNRPFECAADQGKHGAADGDAAVWAVDGAEGPWSSNGDAPVGFSTALTMFDGNWLNWNATDGTIVQQRIDIMKDVTKQLIANIDDVNVGLMRFNRNNNYTENGGPVIFAMEDVETARQTLPGIIDSLPADGFTPLSETLYEAGQYYAGRAVDFGNLNPPIVSVPESRVGGSATSNTYQKPINFQCQKNYIVLLTDGAPTRDTGADSRIQSLPGFSETVGSCDGSGHGACLDDMADYLFHADVDPDLPGDQNVTTYTVGFAVDLPILESTAKRGGGEYRLANDTASLTAVLTQIVQSILDDSTTFTAPSVPVNAFNRTRNLDDVFVSVFQPSNHAHWPGNLKKYRLVNGELVGQDGNAAVDPQTGFFSPEAFSYWSAEPDGDRVGKGGAAHEQPAYQNRRLFTNISGSALTAAANAVAVSNTALTSAMLGVASAERDTLIEWARGRDVLDQDDDGAVSDDRHMMGDPLHVRPLTLIYGGDPSTGSMNATVFISTNDGYLHAIDPSDGSERWAFVPARLLDRLAELYVDDVVPSRLYGLDGEITAYIADNNHQPGISGSEKAYIVFGMRRGGDGLFAMEVTDPDNPELVWELNSNTPGFEDMGQTWSRPHIDRVNIGGTMTDVVIVGGGYDDGQDYAGYREDNVGNAVYMIDLETGALLWSAGPGDATHDHNLVLDQMDNSIPAGVKVVDLTGDDVPDRMYVGDMGGNLWRFDIVNGNSADDLVEGGLLASLGAAELVAPQAADVRRFYASPDVVAVLNDDPAKSYLSINIGSGFRASPMDTATNDEFYSIRDFDIANVIDTDDYPAPITRQDLVDITNDTTPTMLPTDAGWRLAMVASSGEKVLSEAFTFDGEIFFTSFSPGSTSACTASKGHNRLYRVRVQDGSPPPPDDNPLPPDEEPEPEDRYQDLKQGGIAPDAVFFFPEDKDGDPIVCIGAECMDPGFDEGANRTYWFQDETQ